MKKYVYILNMHRWDRFFGGHMAGGIIQGVFDNRSIPAAIAKEKNKKSTHLWVVTRREVK